MAPEEVDLTSATPPKKMKQARLPFAPRPTNKQTTAPVSAPGNIGNSNTRILTESRGRSTVSLIKCSKKFRNHLR